MDTDLTAANGKKVKALEIFVYALQYFKEQALKVGRVTVPVGGGDVPASEGSRDSVEGESAGCAFRKQGRTLLRCWGEWEWCSHCEK